ncbi:MAG TPA: hypothetical protein VG222_08915, partial [Vicinamibacterales bacterium]|nr:hypothetical protein [Vicinamibacterales bacterium]
QTSGVSTALATGDQRTLVMVANFNDTTVSCSADSINNAMFADPAGLSVNGLYKSNSAGQLSFSGQVVGPYALAASSTDACDISGWADAADAQAAAAGLDVASYPRKVYVMPANTCPGAGLGTIGTVQSSRAWIFSCGIQGVFAHEVGHNLGMDHASTPTEEYGDNTDPMSIGTWMLHGVNAPHRVAMGWLGAADTALVDQSGAYDVAPLAADPSVATAPQTLMIWKADTLEYYYLSYRTPLNFDNYIDGTYEYRLSVHRYNSDGTLAKTYLLDGLADGESFVDPVNGITVTQISHDETRATVRVDFTSACVASAPSISISPAVQSALAGSSLSYQVSITNRDASTCPATAFSLSDVAPAGWTAVVSPATLTLGSGVMGQATVTVTSAPVATIGTYTATIKASDPSQTISSSSATATYTVQAPQDTVAPTAPSGLAAAVNQKKKQIALSWNAASDNVGVVGYRVWRNGVVVGTSMTTGWSDQTWTAGASYSYAVSAYDAAGNVSAASKTVTVTLPGGGGGGGGKKP